MGLVSWGRLWCVEVDWEGLRRGTMQASDGGIFLLPMVQSSKNSALHAKFFFEFLFNCLIFNFYELLFCTFRGCRRLE